MSKLTGSKSQIIPYSILLKSLDIATIPALEDLIIEAFYGGLMSGKMDQRSKRLEVISCIGRDVQPNPPSSSAAPTTVGSITDTVSVPQSMDLDNTTSTSVVPVPHKRLPQGTAHTLSSLTSSLQHFQSRIATILHSLDFHIAQTSANAINDLQYDARFAEDVNRTITDLAKSSSTATGKMVEKSEKSSTDFYRIAAGVDASPGMGSASSAVPSSAFGNFGSAAAGVIEEEGEEMEIDPVAKSSTRKTKRGRN